MRKKLYLFSGFLASLLLPFGLKGAIAQPSPLDDRPTGWYGSISPGVVFGYDVNVDSSAFTVEAPPVFGVPVPPIEVAPIEISVDTDTGFGISGAVGYQFEDARVELDVGYNQNTVDGATINGGEAVPLDGRFEVWSLSANGYYDIPTNSAWRPYIGVGAGIASLAAQNVEVNIPFVGQAALNESGISPIFQAQAGIAYDFSETASAFVGYRLQGIPGTQFTVEDVDFDADTVFLHTVQAGARVRF